MDFNEEQLAFYSEIGRAITQWSNVEFTLSWIVSECFHGKDAEKSVAGFRSIENFRSKLQYVDTVVVTQDLSKIEEEKWAKLLDRAGTTSTKRNQLAHHWVLNDLEQKAGRRIMLLPIRPKKTGGRQKYPNAVCLRDVVSYRLEFVALMRALENFRSRLCGRKELFAESLEQPQRPPTIAKIRRGLYADASRPPRPLKA